MLQMHCSTFLLSVVVLASAAFTAQAQEPNPPTWPESVSVFTPSTPNITGTVNAIYNINGGRKDNGQFSSARYALLFMPGRYDIDVPVGYYTQVLGLGAAPTDVVFTGDKGVYCEEGDYEIDIGALDTFWRGAENFQTNSKHLWTDTEGMLWSVSQAAPLRRLVIKNNLKLYEYRGGGAAGYASGGFLSDSVVEGLVASGSQQQWLTRNTNIGKWIEGVWNMVFAGVAPFKGIYDTGAPLPHCGQDIKNCISPYVVIDTVPLIAEKPFISADNTTGKYKLHIPTPRRNSTGADVDAASGTWNTVPSVDFSSVYVANAKTDTAKSINAKLQKGLHVVLAPGIYMLEASLELTHNGQVLLGLGLATLVPTAGTAVVTVAGSTTGCRVAGLLLQAGTTHSETLLQWGSPSPSGGGGGGGKAGPLKDSDYGFIHDVNARVGGPKLPTGSQASAGSMVTIDAAGVIGDNMWLWRADHIEGGGLVKNGDNPCDHGLVVNGDDVTMYALAAEHTLKDIVQWNGENGASYFFQAELPYDVKTYPYAGYAVGVDVKTHLSHGAGVYHFFRDYKVTVQSAITCPPALEASFFDPLAVFLNGNGTILHIINDQGPETAKPAGPGANPQWICANATTASDEVLVPAWVAAPPAPPATCAFGASVPCPNQAGAMCAGTECCGDGSTCPSAPTKFHCCPKPKGYDCTKGDPIPKPAPPGPPPPPPPPPGPPPGPPGPNQCQPSKNVTKNCNVCSACCHDYIMDGKECDDCVKEQCKGPGPGPPSPPSAKHCRVGGTVKCPGTNAVCAGPQCCLDGSICPSADDSFHGCNGKKDVDCTKA